MGSRLDLHEDLVTVLGSRNVYFQPPESVNMKYPCIVYAHSEDDTKFADDILYFHKKRYAVIVIDSDPDSDIPDKVLRLPMCAFDRHYISDNLNHDAYNIYY